jgi:hypothetical protein
LLVWILHGADWRGVAAAWRQVPLWCVAAAVGLCISTVPLRVLQWRWLLGRPQSATFGKTLRALCLGELGNAMLPLRSGELVKTYLLSRSAGLPFAGVLTSTVLARIQDLPPILALLAAILATLPMEEGLRYGPGVLTEEAFVVSASQLHGLLWTLVAGTSVAASLLAAGVWWRKRRGRATASAPVARWWSTLSGQVSTGLLAVEKMRLFWGAQGLSFACWGLFVLGCMPILAAFGLHGVAILQTAAAVVALTTIAHMLPAAPAAIGSFHLACMVALLACNPTMDRDTALAAALLLHAVDTASTALPGLVVLPVSWRDLRRQGERVPAR